MEISEFKKYLDMGFGRAIVFLKRQDATAYREVILHACTHNTAFDTQLEGSRAEFMNDVISLTHDFSFYRPEILAALRISGDNADADQLFDFARLFAQNGDADARQAMYEKFRLNCANGDDTGARALIELDKAEGLIFVAETIGNALTADEESWVDYLLSVANDAGVPNPWETLQEAAPERPGVRAFLTWAEDNREMLATAARERPDPAQVNYDKIKQRIANAERVSPPISLRGWAQHATEDDLRRAALDLLQESNPRRLRAYLRLFSRRRFPHDPGRLIALVSDLDHFTAVAALNALSNIRHADVRSLALRLMASHDDLAARAVALLIENFEPGDHDLVEALAAQSLGPDAYHSLGFATIDFYAAHPDSVSEKHVLLQLYENGLCTFCRERVTDRLMALKYLPDWMAEECQYDANPDIRKKIAAYQP